MAQTRRKFYFLAPTRETPPSGLIKLGNIITLPKNADQPLNPSPLPIDTNVMETFENEVTDYHITLDKTRSGTAGILFSFLMQIMGLGGEVTNIDREEWKCSSVNTSWFEPTSEYIIRSLANSRVKAFIAHDRNWLRATKVFMITGIKVVYGASGTMTYSRKKGIKLHSGVNATNPGAPVSGGVNFGIQDQGNVTENFGNMPAFVLAFRMRRIRVSYHGDIEAMNYTGGMLGFGTKEDIDDKQDDFIVHGLDDSDAEAEEFGISPAFQILDETSGPREQSIPVGWALAE